MRIRRNGNRHAARTKRAQVLMDPREYGRLAAIARVRGLSVGELIRGAVREKYLLSAPDARGAVEDICAMNVPVEDWAAVEREIAEAHGDPDLP